MYSNEEFKKDCKDLRKKILKKDTRNHFTVDSDELFCLSILYSEGERECFGDEQLPQFTIDSISWVKEKTSSRLSEIEESDEYNSLIDYYSDVYAGNFTDQYDMDLDNEECVEGIYKIVVLNQIQKFSSIQILGNMYFSKEVKEKDSYFCAYVKVNGQTIRRPGQIQFFFTHVLDAFDDEGEEIKAVHYFAFVRWYCFADPRSQQLSSFQTENSGAWQDTFEDISQDCILPVHRIYSKISIKHQYLKNINIITFLQQEFF